MKEIRIHRRTLTSESNERVPKNGALFRPSRLTISRQRRGMSKADLAAASGLSPHSISAYENGKRTPTVDNALRLADAMWYPLDFFYSDEVELITPDAVSFRALARMPARTRDTVTASAALAVMLDQWITERYNRPEVDVPDLSSLNPVAAAEALRAEWGLGSDPIPHVIQLLESRGVRVFSLASKGGGRSLEEVFGLSMRWHGTPFVFVNMQVTVERARFSLLHELGHLVLHRADETDSRVAEKEANMFAGYMAVPASRVCAEASFFDSFGDIINAKRKWRTSAMSYLYRMHEEGILDEWRYRELCVRFRRDYGTTEPNPTEEYESSRLLRQVFDDLRAEGGREVVASALDIPLSELDDLIFRHTLTPIVGSAYSKANLKLMD